MTNDKMCYQNEQAIFAIGHTSDLQFGNQKCLTNEV